MINALVTNFHVQGEQAGGFGGLPLELEVYRGEKRRIIERALILKKKYSKASKSACEWMDE